MHVVLGRLPRAKIATAGCRKFDAPAPLVASVAQRAQSAAATTTLDVKAWLAERVGEALGEAFGAEYAGADPLITPATKPEFGDYQCNVAMGGSASGSSRSRATSRPRSSPR